MPQRLAQNQAANGQRGWPVGELPPSAVIFGESASMKAVRQRVQKVARASIPVLIQGESGTGKEVIAKVIHDSSPWAEGPFVKVNCAAIPGTLLESELFGYEKGAFTGAFGSKPGRVELAHGGTLLLDEIAELTPALQAKLLQLLEDGQFSRIGGQTDRQVEVRVLCATNHDLEQGIATGDFRRDFYYRINVVKVCVPPLRDRWEDIPKLAQHFLAYYNEKYACRAEPLSNALLRVMQEYSWPGNIRELENLMRRYVILGSEDVITSELLNLGDSTLKPQIPIDESIPLKKAIWLVRQEVERKIILRVLQHHHWNRKRAARAMKISYRALLYKMRNAGLPNKHLCGVRAEKDLQAGTAAPRNGRTLGTVPSGQAAGSASPPFDSATSKLASN